MIAILPDKSMSMEEKYLQMREDARFEIGDSEENCQVDLAFLRRDIHSPQTLPKQPKVFLSSNCIFNCAYCGCRESNEQKRGYTCTPRELAELSVAEAKRCGSGIFLSSAIYQTPDYTQELLERTCKIIRKELAYTGYLHCKVMPGADPRLIYNCGRYASRLSVNIEVACSEGYRMVAKNKNKTNILTPMSQISKMVAAAGGETGRWRPKFASSQVTQLMAGSSGEDDRTILNLSTALYKKYSLKRVYYTAFHYTHPAEGYDELPLIETPKWRMHRLYQADRLMQLYGFTAGEVLPDHTPNLSEDIDPKAAWALRNIQLFPVEVNDADYDMLLRVPGIGPIYAQRILKARRYCSITHDVLRALGVSLKRARHFITCKGRYIGTTSGDTNVLHGMLSDAYGMEDVI